MNLNGVVMNLNSAVLPVPYLPERIVEWGWSDVVATSRVREFGAMRVTSELIIYFLS